MVPRRRSSGPVRRRRLVPVLALLLSVVSVAAGCTQAQEEPGLFARRLPQPDPDPEVTAARAAVLPTNPRLPVAGEAVWTTGEGLGLTVRFAVHAVRRMAGATVLDWSVTPLTAPGLTVGDPVPGWADLGLERESSGDLSVLLLDPGSGRVYRPLRHASPRELNHCLCTPLWLTERSMRVGETTLLQVAYPEVPSSVRFLDVDLSTLPPFSHVPVTPAGQVPTASHPVDLAAPAPPATALHAPVAFPYPAHDRQSQEIAIEEVRAAPARTSVRWRITSRDDQPSINVLSYGPPIAAPPASQVALVNPSSASGPLLRPTGRSARALSVLWTTQRFQDRQLVDCLCTSLGGWATSLRQRGGQVTVTTNYPALPRGTSTVDVILPGVTTVRGLPVEPAADGASRTGPPEVVDGGHWCYRMAQPIPGWPNLRWPTPLPTADQVRDYRASQDRLAGPTG